MYIQDTGKHATIGDQVSCVYKNGLKVEGIIIYDYGKDDSVIMKILTKDHKFYNFVDIDNGNIQDYQVIKEGPFHKIVENIEPTIKYIEPTIKYSEDGPNTECTVKTNHHDDNYKPFTYKFGESACNVFERWCTTLNDNYNKNLQNLAIISSRIMDIQSDVNSLK